MCGTAYEYKRDTSRYCTERCRYNAKYATSGRVRVPDTLRFSVLYRDGFSCRFCGSRPSHTELQLDHVKPLAQGGAPLDPANLITTCARCNNGHGDKEVDVPTGIVGVYWDLSENHPEEWVECTRFRIVPADDTGYYDIEVE